MNAILKKITAKSKQSEISWKQLGELLKEKSAPIGRLSDPAQQIPANLIARLDILEQITICFMHALDKRNGVNNSGEEQKEVTDIPRMADIVLRVTKRLSNNGDNESNYATIIQSLAAHINTLISSTNGLDTISIANILTVLIYIYQDIDQELRMDLDKPCDTLSIRQYNDLIVPQFFINKKNINPVYVAQQQIREQIASVVTYLRTVQYITLTSSDEVSEIIDPILEKELSYEKGIKKRMPKTVMLYNVLSAHIDRVKQFADHIEIKKRQMKACGAEKTIQQLSNQIRQHQKHNQPSQNIGQQNSKSPQRAHTPSKQQQKANPPAKMMQNNKPQLQTKVMEADNKPTRTAISVLRYNRADQSLIPETQELQRATTPKRKEHSPISYRDNQGSNAFGYRSNDKSPMRNAFNITPMQGTRF